MKLIHIPKYGLFFKVDDCDYERVVAQTWYVQFKNGQPSRLATGSSYRGNEMSIGSFILNTKNLVDHADGNVLNNLRSNLRVATYSENGANKCKQSNNTSGYKGVRYKGESWRVKQWQARIKKDGRETHIGYYATAEEAAVAYNHTARILFGEFARLNVVKPAPEREVASNLESLLNGDSTTQERA